MEKKLSLKKRCWALLFVSFPAGYTIMHNINWKCWYIFVLVEIKIKEFTLNKCCRQFRIDLLPWLINESLLALVNMKYFTELSSGIVSILCELYGYENSIESS